jgi:hypothetical protein
VHNRLGRLDRIYVRAPIYFLTAGEKWKYVRENPVRAGLVAHSNEWTYLGEIFALDYRVERL